MGDEPKRGRGGPGRGQGRKPTPPAERHVKYVISLPPDLAAWLKAQRRYATEPLSHVLTRLLTVLRERGTEPDL